MKGNVNMYFDEVDLIEESIKYEYENTSNYSKYCSKHIMNRNRKYDILDRYVDQAEEKSRIKYSRVTLDVIYNFLNSDHTNDNDFWDIMNDLFDKTQIDINIDLEDYCKCDRNPMFVRTFKTFQDLIRYMDSRLPNTPYIENLTETNKMKVHSSTFRKISFLSLNELYLHRPCENTRVKKEMMELIEYKNIDVNGYYKTTPEYDGMEIFRCMPEYDEFLERG